MDMMITDEMAAETLAADNTPEALAERRAALAAQLAEVDARLAAEKEVERFGAIKRIGELMQQYVITTDELTGKPATRAAKGEPRPSSLTGSKVAPKYRDPATGKTWTGRGLQPLWLKSAIAAGAELESFRIGGAA